MQPLRVLTLLSLLAAVAPAQQFLSRELPGPVVWSEAAIPLDADEDGDLDVLFLNAQGWQVPGDAHAPNDGPLRPTLLINTGNDAEGYPIWVDESATRLPAELLLHGKFAAVGDFDGDGHKDLALAAAFGHQQRLLMKDPDTGAFVDESFRLPTLVLNSNHVAAGDLDDDGDLDLVFADAGPNSFSAPGGKPRLLINDGTGSFTDEPERLGALEKIGAQNAKLIDIDGDLDLDILVDGKSPATHFYRNDGAAVFVLDLTSLPSSPQTNPSPGNLKSTYEIEYADLDGDADFDAMLMNYGFAWEDAAVHNLSTPTGGLVFGVPSHLAIAAPNNHDENEFAFLDADDDGDLDVLVATLMGGASFVLPSTEKLWLNSGSFGVGFLVDSPGAFDAAVDSTLDLAVADFNGDGRYDVISAQGEYTPFTNKFHLNTGAIDSRAPDILRVTPGGTIHLEDALDGLAIRAVICDAAVDDGHSFVSAEAVVDTDKGGEVSQATLAMPHVGGYVHRAAFTPTPTSTGLVGMDVSWRVETADPLGNLALSAVETARICGTETYGTAGPMPGLTLDATSDPIAGQTFGIAINGGPPDVQGLLLAGFARASQPFSGGTLLIDPSGALFFNLGLGSSGSASLQVSIQGGPELVGFGAVLQYAAFDAGQPQGLALSNGLEFVICSE